MTIVNFTYVKIRTILGIILLLLYNLINVSGTQITLVSIIQTNTCYTHDIGLDINQEYLKN